MKQFFHKILSFSLALIVLCSTVSFTVDMHFCGKTLVDFSILKNADSCAMGMKQKPSSNTSMSENGCCSNEEIVVNGQENLKVSLDNFSFEQQVLIVSYFYSYKVLFENKEKEEILFKDYIPPPGVKDIQLLDETFII
ncbi:MAG: hypothetical protein V3U92_16105 [Cellulophaga sp.]